jgi:hypothetical protein
MAAMNRFTIHKIFSCQNVSRWYYFVLVATFLGNDFDPWVDVRVSQSQLAPPRQAPELCRRSFPTAAQNSGAFLVGKGSDLNVLIHVL